jgi:hypothetical protein
MLVLLCFEILYLENMIQLVRHETRVVLFIQLIKINEESDCLKRGDVFVRRQMLEIIMGFIVGRDKQIIFLC